MDNDRLTTLILMILKSRKEDGSPWTISDLYQKLVLVLGPSEMVADMMGGKNGELSKLMLSLCSEGSVNMVDGTLHITPNGERKMCDASLYRFFEGFFKSQKPSNA